MNLGTVIRAARRAKDMTQDDLAGLLGVTLSAVSQWEQGKTMPDTALVPGICSALGISADMLFGLDPDSKEDKIEAVIAEAERMEDRNESPRKVLTLLEDALAAYPDNMKLTEQTAFVLSALSFSPEETSEDRQMFADRSLALYEKILRYSSDEDLRQGAKQSLIYGYAGRRDFARAIELAQTMPTVYIAREELLFSIFTQMRNFPEFQYYKQFFIRRALEKMTFNCRDEEGKRIYDENEMAAIHEKKLAVMEILYNGDYLLSWGAVSFSHAELAEYDASHGDPETSLFHIVRAAEALEAYCAYLAPCVIEGHSLMNPEEISPFTCLLFREGRDDTVGGGGKGDVKNLLDRMAKPVFDPIRARPEFADAASRLRNLLE